MDELIIDTEVRGGPAESVLIKAKALANAELRQFADGAERAWLHAHPVLWLRALMAFRAHVQATIGDASVRIRNLPDDSAERRLREQRLLTSRHFLKVLEERIEEVRLLCGSDPIGPLTGDVIGGLVWALTLLDDGQVAGCRDLLEGLLARVAKQARLGPPPDNSTAAVITVPVAGLSAKHRLNCRACGRGKLDPGVSPVSCPVCAQRHEIVKPG